VPESNFSIPLELNDVISLFYSRQPTTYEIEKNQWIVLMSDVEWNPHSDAFNEEERKVIDRLGYKPRYGMTDRNIQVVSITPHDDDTEIAQLLNISLVFSDCNIMQIAGTSSTDRNYNITKEELAKLCGIGLATATQTLKVTTQKGVVIILSWSLGCDPVWERDRAKQWYYFTY
jgi:hypothetical protein